MSDIDAQYISLLEERVYEKAQFVADRLRQIADDIEVEIRRAKDHGRVQALPSNVSRTVAWGIANAHVGDVAGTYADLVEAREAVRKLEEEK
ncbi:hypothetical protein BH762_gp035 [Gordonia phage OneUp]|uniref:Uncharacterized protein n=1 Tax=Gordonia phage OneUp TaxID=1838074 RepID=A0A161HTA1_9CAUD|nr:hypothetical protein BH762_gp035 [Gordonia phage OneUp]ANA86483.1 hypothetical protein PBI_ONEUP_150 [Gordonia phage OneUp]